MKKLLTLLCSVIIMLPLGSCGTIKCEHKWSNATCTGAPTCEKCGKTEGDPLGHKWSDATCTEPKTCTICGETQGEALGHKWADATCTKPKTCSVCGATEGEALGHDWTDATCTEPKTCKVCSTTEGEALGHDTPGLSCTEASTCTRCGNEFSALGHKWKDATCTDPKTCSVCGETEGKANGHKWIAATCMKPKHCEICNESEGETAAHKWIAATCTEPKTCSVCGETEGEALGHNYKYKIISPATFSNDGVRANVCTRCGDTTGTENYSLSPEEKEKAFKKTCKRYTYDQIARDPGKYEGTAGVYTGEVIQVMQSGNNLTLRVDITAVHGYSTYYKDTILVYYTLPSGAARILEDDIITIYGINSGIYTYESVLGADITVPLVNAKYIN